MRFQAPRALLPNSSPGRAQAAPRFCRRAGIKAESAHRSRSRRRTAGRRALFYGRSVASTRVAEFTHASSPAKLTAYERREVFAGPVQVELSR